MKKKIAILGRGTAGSLAAAHFAHYMEDHEISWYYDPNIATQPVGEGSTLVLPIALLNTTGFSYENLSSIDGYFKTGIFKKYWGMEGKAFTHTFPPPSVAYHFSAKKLQEYIFNCISDKINVFETNITNKDIDADHIIDCSGASYNSNDFLLVDSIPVNSVFVNQCFWDYPRFTHSLTVARKYGWVFGIPLQNRCSIGYLYNKDINTLDEVLEDLKEVFSEFGLNPSNTTNSFSFKSYYRKNNFSERVSYNGNSSFFLEPLEATSIATMDENNKLIFDIINSSDTLDTATKAQGFFENTMKEVEHMIMLHYFAGSTFKTKFWQYAQEKAETTISEALKVPKFRNVIDYALKHKTLKHAVVNTFSVPSYGQWGGHSFFQNINGLGIKQKLINEIINNAYNITLPRN